MPPALATVPSASTTVEPMMRSRAEPYARRRGPAQPAAIAPPTVPWPGRGASIGTNWPFARRVRARSASFVPANTETVKSFGSYAAMPAMAASDTATS